ncbi:sensor histidine kinase [Amnibacterium endophyticum]|uniref:histidine kinase n=1 Tax=Amnibacterium endophyticum TaxID=2109337 RepID=A0ABW4LJC0_9MICO
METPIDARTADRILAAVAGVAAVIALVEGPKPLWAIALIGLALVPWVLVLVGRDLPPLLFVGAAVLPIVPVVAFVTIGVVVFMTTSAASRYAARVDDPRRVAAVAVGVAAVPFLCVLSPHPDLYGALYFAFGDLFGVLVGALQRRAARLATRLREADARLAEAEQHAERQRIARDVHDLVAHSLTVVVLHVGGARRVLRLDPAAAEGALAEAERVCRESLDGIRGVVGLLRDVDGPQPVSLDLDALAGTYRDAGLPVELRSTGDQAALPLATRVVLYRVVQEALANAARYAPPGEPVAVEVAVTEDGALVRVRNRRAESRVRSGAGGFGLRGLREQVAAVHGVLTSGPDGDGWLVACRLPVRRPAPVGLAAAGEPG